MSRRRLLAWAPLTVALGLLSCGRRPLADRQPPERRPADEGFAREGRLAARPGPPPVPAEEVAPGLQPLGLAEEGRDGLVYVPPSYQAAEPAALLVALHGAGGDAHGALGPLLSHAEATGLILLAPESRGRTWDALLGGYGPDVVFVDRSLRHTFGRHAIDPARIGVEGFSDGASYALGLGLANGDLFRRIIAFSPGFAPRGPKHGRPATFVSHGTADDVLPIDRCSRRIVPALREAGYEVRYREFEGGHEVPADIVDEAFAWWQRGG